MATTQEASLGDIRSQLEIINHVKADLVDRMKNTTNKIHIDYLKEKIKGLNTEIRILTNIQTAFRRTIIQRQKLHHKNRLT